MHQSVLHNHVETFSSRVTVHTDSASNMFIVIKPIVITWRADNIFAYLMDYNWCYIEQL